MKEERDTRGRCILKMDSERTMLWDSLKGIAIISIFLVHNYVLGNIVFNQGWGNMLLSKGRYGKVVWIYIFLLLFSIAVHIHTKYELFIVSEKEGKFAISTVVQSADASKHSIVIVLPGKYEENIVLDDRDVSLVGLNKKITIIIDKTDRYNNAPISAYGSFRLYNLTLKMTLDNAEEGTDSFLYDKGKTTLLSSSRNNSSSCLNAQ